MAGNPNIVLRPDERIVISSNGDKLVLTNRRVRLNTKSFGRSRLVSITLDSVASCALLTRSHPIFLVVAVLLLLAATQYTDMRGVLVVAALICTAAYLGTRKTVLVISSSGGSEIVVPAAGMKRDRVVDFVDAVEREKLVFLEEERTGAKVAGADE